MNQATAERVRQLFQDQDLSDRFIPYVSMYEIEALYFSDPACLAEKLGVAQRHIDAILLECKEPENINDHSETSPSKRLENLSDRFKKTSTGIAIATEIGIPKMCSAPGLRNWNRWQRGEMTNAHAGACKFAGVKTPGYMPLPLRGIHWLKR